MRSREELAWAAGFFEGEGSFGKRGVTINQVNRAALERFQSAIGFGKLYGPYDNSNHGQKRARPAFRWQVNSFEKCQALVAMLWHGLTSKRRSEARVMLNRMLEMNRLAVRASRLRHPRAQRRIV